MKTVIWDLETTSAEKDTCRIIQLALKVIEEDGTVTINKSKMYNPGVPITPSATEVHGITGEMVKNEPSFSDDAKKLKKIFENSILVGYNLIIFDIPIILYEFDRCGIELNLSGQVIDVMKFETLLESRKLASVYERYTGKPMENAHSAMGDIIATETVLQYQLEKAKRRQLNEDEVMEAIGFPKNAADYFGKFKYDDNGDLVFNFGKHLKKKVKDEIAYANWMLGESFPSQVKKLIREELQKSTKQIFTH